MRAIYKHTFDNRNCRHRVHRIDHLIYRMKKDSLLLQKLRLLFTWSSPSRSSDSPTMSERISSAIVILAPPYLRFRREDASLTIIKIPRVRIQRPGNDSKFDLLKLFALDAGSFGESLFCFLEDLALKGVSTSESQKQKWDVRTGFMTNLNGIPCGLLGSRSKLNALIVRSPSCI